jgi:mannose-6-phosphate isomerase-like protein (cupin superfamily)
MERVATDDLDDMFAPAEVKRSVADALEATNLALNYYELAPGDRFGVGYHRHPNQEEVFYVIEGTATFETETGDVEVGPDGFVRFAPGEWQVGRNEGPERVRALALGAPKESPETEVVRECPDCGERTHQRFEITDDTSALLSVCAACGAETGRYT